MTYDTIEHIADLGVRVAAPDEPALFAESVAAMRDLMTAPEGLRPRETATIAVEGADRADLLVNWLREVLYLWHGRDLLAVRAEIDQWSERRLRGRVQCDPYDPNRHELRHELKAVTYHELRVEPGPDGWEAVVVFDV
jgi:SHS2 domain-containing protein